jgi:hypothetical protein
MIIHVALDGSVELREPDEFRSFKIAGPAGAPVDFLARALAGIATLEPDGKTAWVSQAALTHWQGAERPAEWRQSFDKMVDSVRRFGWVRDGDGAVRAHIELGA